MRISNLLGLIRIKHKYLGDILELHVKDTKNTVAWEKTLDGVKVRLTKDTAKLLAKALIEQSKGIKNG